MSTVKSIKALLIHLSDKDKAIAEKYILSRNYDALKEIVDSALIIKKKRIQTDESPEYIDLDGLNTLKSEVDLFIMNLEYDEDE